MLLRRLFLKIRIPLVILILFFVAIFIFPFPTVGRTFLLITELVPIFSFKPLELISAQPIVEHVEIWQSDSKMMKADIYRPRDNKKHTGAILAAYGIDPESGALGNFATGLARSGFAVLVPVDQDLIDISMKREDTQKFIDSFEYMSKASYVDRQKIGFIGVCAAGSVSLVASGIDQIADRVKFVVAISPYYDGYSVYSEVFTKLIKSDDKIYSWEPNQTSLAAMEKLMINSLPEDESRALSGVIFSGEPANELDDLPKAKKVYDFIHDVNAQNFDQSFGRLPDEPKEVIAQMSPSRFVKKIKSKVFIIADSRDNFIPNAQARELANNLPVAQREITFIDLLEHSQLTRRLPRLVTIGQLAKLGVFTYKILDFTK